MFDYHPCQLNQRRLRLSSCVAAMIAAAGPATTAAATRHASTPFAAIAAYVSGGAMATATQKSGGPALASGTTIPVASCADDGGFDTLRHAVLVADPGDTIDLSGLSCGKITLQSGAIVVSASDLTLVGPGAQKLTIDGNAADRVFNHGGAGILTLDDLTIANGKVLADMAEGGCIYAIKGGVSLHRSVVTSCAAIGQTAAAGGAIVAYSMLSATDSTIAQNEAYATVGAAGTFSCAGGALFVPGKVQLVRSILSGNKAHAPIGKVYGGASFSTSLSAKYSTISGNIAQAAGDVLNSNYSVAGASVSGSDTQIVSSTIDNNSADAAGAMLFLDEGTTASILQSTISSNVGTQGVGAISSLAALSISNSTFAFNVSGSLVPAGLQLNAAVALQSTIIADNPPFDIASGPVIGSNNLVKNAYDPTTLPPGTITLDPKLGPLALNGGTTRTHALGPGSPALNAGGNPSNFSIDQRGPTYRRVVGAAADIGAFEVDLDHIFGSAFSNPDK